MIEAMKSFDVIDWLVTGGLSLIITSVITILVMLIKQKITSKADITQRKILNESTMSTLVALGTDISSLLNSVQMLATNITSIVDVVNAGVKANQISNTNIASFVLECFSVSNLSDEKKTALKALFEKTFFSDNEQFIESLKAAKLGSDTALAEAQKIIENMRKTIEAKDAEILALDRTNKSRRI